MSSVTAEVAETVSPEVKVAAAQAVCSEGPVEVSEVLRGKQAQVLALVQRLLASAGLSGKFSLPAELTDATRELFPEALEACLKGLEVDYGRGIVVVDDKKTVDEYKIALAADKTAGTTWDVVRARLEANEGALLKKAAEMQGGGELIGVDTKGELVIISRAGENGNREPEIFAFRESQVDGIGDQRKPKKGEKPILINTGTLDREALMAAIGKSGLFADYWEIRQAVAEGGYSLPPDSTDYKKEGIVAAVEVVTGEDFVRSTNGEEWRSAILECGDVSRSAFVRVVSFTPADGRADVHDARPEARIDERGAVRVLRG